MLSTEDISVESGCKYSVLLFRNWTEWKILCCLQSLWSG